MRMKNFYSLFCLRRSSSRVTIFFLWLKTISSTVAAVPAMESASAAARGSYRPPEDQDHEEGGDEGDPHDAGGRRPRRGTTAAAPQGAIGMVNPR